MVRLVVVVEADIRQVVAYHRVAHSFPEACERLSPGRADTVSEQGNWAQRVTAEKWLRLGVLGYTAWRVQRGRSRWGRVPLLASVRDDAWAVMQRVFLRGRSAVLRSESRGGGLRGRPSTVSGTETVRGGGGC